MIEALYIHIPFCAKRCDYCDFSTSACSDDALMDAYVDALSLQLRRASRAGLLGGVKTIYIGGGTPSLISASGMHFLLDGVRELFELSPGCEISMEANPGTAPESRFADYADAGVNRLSLGVQSFSDEMLRVLGRVHSAAQAKRSAFDCDSSP